VSIRRPVVAPPELRRRRIPLGISGDSEALIPYGGGFFAEREPLANNVFATSRIVDWLPPAAIADEVQRRPESR
jgi:hypothetical protein